MNWRTLTTILIVISATGCRHAAPPESAAAAVFGAAIVNLSDDALVTGVGAVPYQSPTVQVNDADGNGVAGALVEFTASGEAQPFPATGLTGSDGQLSTRLRLGSNAGRYILTATTRDKAGKPLQTRLTAIALDYQESLGRELSEKHCARCHDPQSTAERVSNRDNLGVPPHSFSDGDALNQISRANLIAIIAHGGQAVGKSPEMPPYSPTLSTSEITALVAYIRAIANPPWR
jgi:mono/diheme cytochrome c family protein